jgi:hypothetical protein
MSAMFENQHSSSRVVERYIALHGPNDYLRSKQQAAFFGVIMVAYLTIATLIPQDDISISHYNSLVIEKEEDWEDVQDEDAPLTPVQSWGEYTRVRPYLFFHHTCLVVSALELTYRCFTISTTSLISTPPSPVSQQWQPRHSQSCKLSSSLPNSRNSQTSISLQTHTSSDTNTMPQELDSIKAL